MRVQLGGADAFGEVYERYARAVFLFIEPKVEDRQVAEDLTSETFLRALRHIRQSAWQGSGIRIWLLTIAKNLLIDFSNSACRVREVPMADVAVLCVDEADVEDLVTAHWAERGGEWQADGELADGTSFGVEARLLQDCDFAEVAAQTGITMSPRNTQRSAGDAAWPRPSADSRLVCPSAESDGAFHLLVDELSSAVSALKREQRECLVYRLVDRLSVAQTAELMGLSEGATKILMHRARRSLAARLAGHARASGVQLIFTEE
jgi:RNA polymerase sigma factor (sigma-70 family)